MTKKALLLLSALVYLFYFRSFLSLNIYSFPWSHRTRVMEITHLNPWKESSEANVFLKEMKKKNPVPSSCQLLQRSDRKQQTGMGGLWLRTGRLCSGWLKTVRTSLVPIFWGSVILVTWGAWVQRKLDDNTHPCNSLFALLPSSKLCRSYLILYHQTKGQLLSSGCETPQPILHTLLKRILLHFICCMKRLLFTFHCVLTSNLVSVVHDSYPVNLILN